MSGSILVHDLLDELDDRRIALRGRNWAHTAAGVRFLLHCCHEAIPFHHRDIRDSAFDASCLGESTSLRRPLVFHRHLGLQAFDIPED